MYILKILVVNLLTNTLHASCLCGSAGAATTHEAHAGGAARFRKATRQALRRRAAFLVRRSPLYDIEERLLHLLSQPLLPLLFGLVLRLKQHILALHLFTEAVE